MAENMSLLDRISALERVATVRRVCVCGGGGVGLLGGVWVKNNFGGVGSNSTCLLARFCPVNVKPQAMSSLMAENKSLLDRISALERVASRANGLAPSSPPPVVTTLPVVMTNANTRQQQQQQE